MKGLVVEMHRWIGAAIEPHIASLQAVVQQELRESFTTGGAQPTRYLRSQQHRVRDAPSADAPDGAAEDEDVDAAGGDSVEMDPFDMLDPVEILSKLPKDFYEKLEATKWQERKEALDALDNLLKTAPRLEPGDYADLVRALKKV
ncbi:protein mini spindles-like [Choristoneura fumiferana]